MPEEQNEVNRMAEKRAPTEREKETMTAMSHYIAKMSGAQREDLLKFAEGAAFMAMAVNKSGTTY